MTRVAVFIDYQNSYHCAREAFGNPKMDHPTMGHVYPAHLGKHLVKLGKSVDANRILTHIRIYRGQPVQPGHPMAIAAAQRQLNSWRQNKRLVVKTRPLRYRQVDDDRGGSHWKGEEKGIDVLMALDIAIEAIKGSYDVGIVVSADTDLVPAVEQALEAGKRIETATWRGPNGSNKPLRIDNHRLWNHQLGSSDFDLVQDDTDYSRRADQS